MSEKLYAVKNDEGEYWDFEFAKFRPVSKVYHPAYIDEERAKVIAHEFGGHIVTLIEEPEKVKLPEKAAEWVAYAKSSGHDITDIFDEYPMPDEVSYWLYDDDNEAEHREERGLMLVNAYQYGYTVEKEKKYNGKVPHTKEVWYYKSGDAYLLTICPEDKKLRGTFTESEIKHYGLQDCEKEEVTEYDEQ